MIDIGAKAEGSVSADEFLEQPKVNDEVYVYIQKLEDKNGNLKLSHKIARTKLAMDNIEDCYKNNQPITGKIKQVVNAGFIVDIGVEAFLPISQLIKQKITKPEIFLNKTYEFKIIELDKSRGKIVISRRRLLDELEEKEISEFFEKYKEGDVVKGTVENFLEFGVIIRLTANLSGLLHRTNISWAYIEDFKSMFKKGEELTLKILEMNREQKKISLGLKQMTEDPWNNIEKRYFKDKIVSGKIKKIEKSGIQISLETAVTAFLPNSEISWMKSKERPHFKVGDSLNIKIIEVNKEKKSIIVSLKQKSRDPWGMIKEKMESGSVVEAVVSNIVKNNILVLQLFNGLEGIVPKKYASWDEIENLEKAFKIGQTVQCKILEVNDRENKILLSIKDTQEDPWYERAKKLEKEKTFKCKVLKILKNGVIVQIDKTITGYIHISQLTDKNIKSPDEVVKVGDEIFANISNIDYNNRKISLSVKDYLAYQETRELKNYLKQQSDMDSSIGALINLEKLLDDNSNKG